MHATVLLEYARWLKTRVSCLSGRRKSCHSYLARLETLGATWARDWVELSSYSPVSVEAFCVCRLTLLTLD